MNISVAGKDRSQDLGQKIDHAAEQLRKNPDAPEYLPLDYSALSLRDAADAADYLNRLIELIRRRSELNTIAFRIPRAHGPIRRVFSRVRAVLWRVLRYQHDHMAFQQNIINTQTASFLEFLFHDQRQEITRLRERIEQLEAQLRGDR